MNSLFKLLALNVLFLIYCNFSFSATGDTTKITIFDNVEINNYGAINASVELPESDKNFQKVRLLYTLGKRSCPGEQYCGSWDYTTSVYAKNANTESDSLELMRVITPYVTDWTTNDSFTYVEEVTDYLPILHDDVDFTYFYEGYSWGFTLTLTIEMIEGDAPRKAVDVTNIYDGHFQYGSNSDPIESHLTEKTVAYDAPAENALIRNIITGHGSDNSGCGEFCSKWYRQKVGGNQIAQVQLWKSDCGMNQLYPQTGTWIFERANWCPGEKVTAIEHDLTGLALAGEDFTVDMDMQPYTASAAEVPPSYYISSHLITYEAPTYQLDASITDILAPTSNENYARFNPICSNPIIKIRNEGAQDLTSLKIAYKIEGGATKYFDWSGNLAFMEEEVVTLDALSLLNDVPSNTFVAEIVEMNGNEGDETDWNNIYRSKFEFVPNYPSEFRIAFKTNKSVDPSNSPYSETNWKILNEDGDIVKSRIDNAVNTSFIDTISLAPGCYTFIMDDAGCDGISWWYYPYYAQNPGNGVLKFIQYASNSPVDKFNGDFGCQLIQSFTVGGTAGIEEEAFSNADINLFPNPAQNSITLAFPMEVQDIDYEIYDARGSLIIKNNSKSADKKVVIGTEQLENGMYYIKVKDTKENQGGYTKKFLIQK